MRGVDLEAVSLAYGTRPILRDVTLRVEPAERLVLLGASGSGKSTLLRLVAGFLAPDHGVIRLGGDVVAQDGRITLPPEERRVGMVFQDLALCLKAQGIPHRERERLIQETLEMVGLNTFAESKPTRLSGGEQQRVALARALVLRPDILLMDEPLSSLDDALSLQLRREIVRLHAEFGFTLLYVTHRRDEAADIASRVVRVEGGRVAPVLETSVAVGPRAGP